jgi:hypothetical protein
MFETVRRRHVAALGRIALRTAWAKSWTHAACTTAANHTGVYVIDFYGILIRLNGGTPYAQSPQATVGQ